MAEQNPIPFGFCACGCGCKTNLAPQTDLKRGYVRGQPNPFVLGHRIATTAKYRSGRKHSRQHVDIAEVALGKPLPKGVEVHHVNGNGRDNRNKNLVICQDGAYHKLLHARARIVRVGGNPDLDSWCSRCKRPRPRSMFHVRLSGPRAGDLTTVCKPCCHEKYKAGIAHGH